MPRLGHVKSRALSQRLGGSALGLGLRLRLRLGASGGGGVLGRPRRLRRPRRPDLLQLALQVVRHGVDLPDLLGESTALLRRRGHPVLCRRGHPVLCRGHPVRVAPLVVPPGVRVLLPLVRVGPRGGGFAASGSIESRGEGRDGVPERRHDARDRVVALEVLHVARLRAPLVRALVLVHPFPVQPLLGARAAEVVAARQRARVLEDLGAQLAPQLVREGRHQIRHRHVRARLPQAGLLLGLLRLRRRELIGALLPRHVEVRLLLLTLPHRRGSVGSGARRGAGLLK